ncbi:MAG: AI-2E family transporter, partial [Geminicoccaceae bacterium]
VQALGWLIAPTFLALVIVIAVNPVQRWLLDHGWPGWAATLVLLVVTYGVIVVFGLVVTISLGRLASELPSYAANAQSLQAGVADTLERFGVSQQQAQQMLGSFSPDGIGGLVQGLLSSLSSALSSFALLATLLLFLTLEASGVGARLASLSGQWEAAAGALVSFAKGTRKYLVVTTVFGLIVATLDTIGLTLIGVPLALLWGVLTFVTNYIPNVGFFLALIPPAVLGLVVGGWPMALGVVALYCVVGTVVQTIIQPRVMGNSVGLSATVTFVALVFWAWLIGPLGALLAVPLTLLAKSLLVDIDPRASWLDSWLRAERPGPVTRPG